MGLSECTITFNALTIICDFLTVFLPIINFLATILNSFEIDANGKRKRAKEKWERLNKMRELSISLKSIKLQDVADDIHNKNLFPNEEGDYALILFKSHTVPYNIKLIKFDDFKNEIEERKKKRCRSCDSHENKTSERERGSLEQQSYEMVESTTTQISISDWDSYEWYGILERFDKTPGVHSRFIYDVLWAGYFIPVQDTVNSDLYISLLDEKGSTSIRVKDIEGKAISDIHEQLNIEKLNDEQRQKLNLLTETRKSRPPSWSFLRKELEDQKKQSKDSVVIRTQLKGGFCYMDSQDLYVFQTLLMNQDGVYADILESNTENVLWLRKQSNFYIVRGSMFLHYIVL